MSSLRSRILLSVLTLAAVGMVSLGAITYAEQNSFLQNRLNREVEEADAVASHALDEAGFKPTQNPPATPTTRGSTPSTLTNPDAHSNQGHPGPTLPPGTYAERKTASGSYIGSREFNFGQTQAAHPKIPANAPVGRLFTVGSIGSSGLRYRVYVHRDPDDRDLTLVAVPLTEVDQTLNRLLVVEALVIVAVLLGLGVSAFFVVRLGLRPLDRIEVTAGEIAAGELSRRVSPATPKTEVGRLGIALNEMLDRLESAFAEREASEDRLRRFLADASHELRTPLASIRGYAELYRMGASSDADGTELAMRRIEEESKRMGVLVEDLLTLARLDETPELSRAPVDLSLLARDAVDDARATAPDRQISVSAPAAATVSGDAHQLRQVFANLLRNALVHTPPRTPIEVSVSSDPHTVTMLVRDHGPGLPPGAQNSLFERFWRAEGGRERGKAGAGLGMAIVSSIVAAHDGEISAQNAPDGGAIFMVRIPLAAVPRTAPSHA
jgi:two-component system OmpR family sensor kinase